MKKVIFSTDDSSLPDLEDPYYRITDTCEIESSELEKMPDIKRPYYKKKKKKEKEKFQHSKDKDDVKPSQSVDTRDRQDIQLLSPPNTAVDHTEYTRAVPSNSSASRDSIKPNVNF